MATESTLERLPVLSPVQTGATLLDVTCCVRLHSLLHVVGCCCVLSRKVWNRSNFSANNSQHFFCSVMTATMAQQCWEFLRPFARSLKKLAFSSFATFFCLYLRVCSLLTDVFRFFRQSPRFIFSYTRSTISKEKTEGLYIGYCICGYYSLPQYWGDVMYVKQIVLNPTLAFLCQWRMFLVFISPRIQ